MDFLSLDVQRPTLAELTAPHADVGVALIYLTQPLAKALIEGQHLDANRAMSPGTIEAYRRDMLAKRWYGRNGETISFNQQGKLINGEHRVRAVAGVSDSEFGIEVLCFTGINPVARATMDDPRRRSAADELNMLGDKWGTKVVSALRSLAIITTGLGAGARMSKPALLDLYRHNPDMLTAVKTVYGLDAEALKNIPIRLSVVTAMYYVARFKLGKETLADDMLEVLRTGLPNERYTATPDRDPMRAWMRYVQGWNNTKSHNKVTEGELTRGTIYAWELFALGQPITGKTFVIPGAWEPVEGLTVEAVYGDMFERGELEGQMAANTHNAKRAASVPEAREQLAKAAKAVAPKATAKGAAKGSRKAKGANSPSNGDKDGATTTADQTPQQAAEYAPVSTGDEPPAATATETPADASDTIPEDIEQRWADAKRKDNERRAEEAAKVADLAKRAISKRQPKPASAPDAA